MCAKQKGAIKLKGLLGNLMFYQKNGKSFVQEVSFPSKSKIQNAPSFKRRRENMMEFGGCSMAAKAFRMGLGELSKFMGGAYISARLTARFKQVNMQGSGERGKRSIELLVNKGILEEYDFNPDTTFGSVFSAPFDIMANIDRNVVTVTIPVFNTNAFVSPPLKSTHFRIVNAAVVLSDYTYDPAMRLYKPVNPLINKLNSITYSDYTVLGNNISGIMTIVSAIPGSPVIPTTAGVIACLGIEFYQEINGDYYQLAAKNAMRLERVF
ncbi:MAG: hypothetical protein M3Q58_11615 [Bacteroidota bacterium]|nr:hypothetical protein [Bacteroidota bacterium]